MSLSELIGVSKVNPAQAARETLAAAHQLAEASGGMDEAVGVYLMAAQTFATLAVADALRATHHQWSVADAICEAHGIQS